MEDYIINTENLTKQYGTFFAVDNVSLSIKRGEIFGLVGKNGAGKTTLIRLLTGSARATSGTFSISTKKDVTAVSGIIETPALFLGMSATDNLIVHSKLLNVPVDINLLEKTLSLVGLDPSSPRRVKNFSMGMKQRLAVAKAILCNPELLILDEPTNGLDPQGIRDIRELLLALHKEGVTVLISSHILSELSKVATSYAFMNNGKVVKQITAEQLNELNGRAKLRVSVADSAAASQALTEKGFVCEIVGETMLDVDTEQTATDVILALSEFGMKVKSVNSVGGGLEDFFINITGGAQ